MKTISRVFSYVYYFLAAETKELRAEAYKAAQKYYAARPLRSSSNPTPHPVDYERRRLEFTSFQRGYINTRCHEIATEKLATTNR
jgi:hypothetical protein